MLDGELFYEVFWLFLKCEKKKTDKNEALVAVYTGDL